VKFSKSLISRSNSLKIFPTGIISNKI
jgi:hypothetical protein